VARDRHADLTRYARVDIGGGNEMVSAITKSGAESLELEVGAVVTVVVKANEVMLARD
jgi:molybdopterin-binding protein